MFLENPRNKLVATVKENQESAFSMSEVMADDQQSRKPVGQTRTKVFRTICVAAPVVLGLIAVVAILLRNEWIVWDSDRGFFKFQRPPLYVQEPGFRESGHRYLFDERLGWRNIPNWSAETSGKPLTINSHGFRGPECTVEKPPGVHRILVLGDSYAWGYGVGDSEVFSAVLERKLGATDEGPWEVLNTAVSGWGTDQQYLYLKTEGVNFEPDIVVLAFFPVNDIDNNSSSVQYGLNKPVFLDSRLTDPPSVPKPNSNARERTTRENHLELTLAIIEAVAKVCEDRNAQLVVLKFGAFLHPGNLEMQESSTQLATRISGFSKSVAFIDLDEIYVKRGINLNQLVLGNKDGHWNAFGHNVTAEILLEFITKPDDAK